jgi:hypothetical protein
MSIKTKLLNRFIFEAFFAATDSGEVEVVFREYPFSGGRIFHLKL